MHCSFPLGVTIRTALKRRRAEEPESTRAASFKRLLGAGTTRSSIARQDYPWNTRATSCPCCPAVRCSTSCCRPGGPAVSSSRKLSADVDVDLDSRLQLVPHGTRLQTRAGADPNPNATRL